MPGEPVQLASTTVRTVDRWYLYVTNNPSASLTQPLPRNSDGGDLQDEKAKPVAYRDS